MRYVVDLDGTRGTISRDQGGKVTVDFGINKQVTMPATLLQRKDDQTYYLYTCLEALERSVDRAAQ